MRLWRTFFFLAMAMTLILVAAAPAAAQTEFVEILRDTDQIWVGADDVAATALFPISFQDVQGTDVSLRLLDVSRDNTPDESRLGLAFDPTLQSTSDPLHPSPAWHIQVDVDLAKIEAPGTYHLLLELSSPKAVQNVTVAVIVPPAQLTTSPKALRVVRTRSFWSWLRDVPDVRAPGVVIRETSGLSRVTALTSWSEFDDVYVSGPVTLAFDSTSTAFGPAGMLDAPVSSVHDFPLGAWKGKLSIDAKELLSPATIDLEVYERNSPWWLLIAVVLGLLLGNLLRHVLLPHIALEEARRAGIDLLLRARPLRERFEADPGLKGELNDWEEALIRGMEKATPADVREAVNTAKDELQKLIEKGKQLPAPAAAEPPLSLDVLKGWQDQSLRRQRGLEAARTALLAVVLVFATYVLYIDNYVGTLKELATIFFAAFAFDLTVEAVNTFLSAKAPTGKPV